jgi:hypothetical protein
VHVAHRAIDARGLFQQPDEAGGLEVSRLPGLDAGIARLALQQRQPADLEVCGADPAARWSPTSP